ncbi:MAG: phospholipase D-like domain-containing protein [Sandaracinaceae bacterium]
MRALAVAAWMCLALGCDARPEGADAGGPASDAGVMDAASGDAGLPTDASMDASADAGLAPGDAGLDAAGPAGCACPALPPSCVPPTPLAPAFAPDATDIGAQLLSVVACAESRLRIAVYEASWECLRVALQGALDRDPDLVLEIVVDDRECPTGTCFVDGLTPADRVTVRRDDRTGLMHHKFAIADESWVWVGSTNFTARSFCTDLNDSLAIDDPVIIGRYGEVFDRMFDGEFGPVAPEGATESGPYAVWFSPESPTSAPAAWLTAMIAAIGEATTSVDVLIFAWTRTEIADALIAAAARGVEVRAIVAGSYADDPPAQALLAAGIDVRVASVHSKVMILDAATVVTGSANWSENAWSNDENSLWVTDDGVAGAYLARFEEVWGTATAATPAP